MRHLDLTAVGRPSLLYRACLVVTLAIVFGAPCAEAKKDDPVLDLYVQSSAQLVVREFPRMLEAFLVSSRDAIPPRFYDGFLHSIRAAADTAAMDSAFLACFREGISLPTAKAAMTFIQSPSGLKVTEAERRSSTPEGVVAMQQHLQDHPETDPARVELLSVLDAAVGATQLGASSGLSIQYAILLAYNATRPEEERQTADALWALTQSESDKALAAAAENAATSFAYIYRAITKDEIRDYIEFAMSEEGLRYHRVLRSCFERMNAAFNIRMASALAEKMTK